MKFRLSLWLIITFLLSYSAQAQITVDNTLTAKQLIEDYLIGEGIEVDNITINGQSAETVNNQAGLYEGPSNVIDFNQGLLMVTGDANTVAGGMGGGLTHTVLNDPDLMAISSQSIRDAIIIEFDFLATSDSIKFNYVFASNEYPDYTCSTFNDAFGFFLSGAGIEGPYSNNSKNIALIPGTETPVAINTINAGVASAFNGNPATCAAANPDWVEHSQYFVNNCMCPSPPTGDVQFPGMTQTFTARSAVQCGEWYHIKLAIGDAVDGSLDSGVFLEAGSFAAYGDVFLSVTPQIGGNVVVNPLYEDVLVAGCSEAYIELTRPTGMSTDSIFVEIGGTAIPGVDYIFGEDDTLFFFPEGIDTIGFNITTIWSGIPSDDRYITITINYKDGCNEEKSASVTIEIVDPYDIDSTVENIVLTCPADQVLISAQGLDGIEPYKYDWGDYGSGDNLSEVWVDVPADSAYYLVTIRDACDFEDPELAKLDSVLVVNKIPDPLQATIDPFVHPECPNEPVDLHASIQDGNGEYYIEWKDGNEYKDTPSYYLPEEHATVAGPNREIVSFIPEPYKFTEVLPVYLTVIDTCGTTVRDTVYINYPYTDPIRASFNSLDDHCPTEPIVIQGKIENGLHDLGYAWSISNGSFGEGADPTANRIHVVPDAGENEYTLTVSDYCGRTGTDYEYIHSYVDDEGNSQNELKSSGRDTYTDILQVIKLDNIMNVITPNGDRKNDYFVIEGVYEFDNARLEVYDRWGKMIYHTDNYRAGLENPKPDDVFDADGYEDGTYFYIINVNSGECVQSGTIEVLRGNN